MVFEIVKPYLLSARMKTRVDHQDAVWSPGARIGATARVVSQFHIQRSASNQVQGRQTDVCVTTQKVVVGQFEQTIVKTQSLLDCRSHWTNINDLLRVGFHFVIWNSICSRTELAFHTKVKSIALVGVTSPISTNTICSPRWFNVINTTNSA